MENENINQIGEENLPQVREKNGMNLLDQSLIGGDLEVSMKKAEKYLEIQDRVRKLAINLTSAQDWINEGGKPYLQWTGTSKIAMAFGVSYEGMSYKEKFVEDDKGSYVTYECTGFVTWQGRKLPEAGTGSSRDAFFGRKDGAWLPVSEVDLNNIKKKALTNFLNRGLKSMIGLSFTWEEIEKATGGRITSSTVQEVKFKGKDAKKENDSPELKAKKMELGKMIMEMCKGDKKSAQDYLEHLTTWTDTKTGKTNKGKRDLRFISEKQLDYKWAEVLEAYNTFHKDIKPPLGKYPEVSSETPTNGVSEIPEEEKNEYKEDDDLTWRE